MSRIRYCFLLSIMAMSVLCIGVSCAPAQQRSSLVVDQAENENLRPVLSVRQISHRRSELSGQVVSIFGYLEFADLRSGSDGFLMLAHATQNSTDSMHREVCHTDVPVSVEWNETLADQLISAGASTGNWVRVSGTFLDMNRPEEDPDIYVHSEARLDEFTTFGPLVGARLEEIAPVGCLSRQIRH